MIEAESPMQGPYKTAHDQARANERAALRQEMEEQKAKQDVTGRVDAIEQKLKDWETTVNRARLLRGEFPMRVDGDIVSIDPTALGDQVGNSEQFDCWRDGALVIRRLVLA